MDVDQLWEARVTDYSDDVFARVHQYKHINASRLGLSSRIKDLRVLIVERAVAAWE